MLHDIIIPRPGESISEVVISRWLVANNQQVEKNQEIAEVESDKATLPLIASESGAIEILIPEGQTVSVGLVACRIDTDKQGTQANIAQPTKKSPENKQQLQPQAQPIAEIESNSTINNKYADVKLTPMAEKLMQEHQLTVEDVIKGLQRIGKKEVEAVIDLRSSQSNQMPTTKSREEKREPMSQLRKKLSKRLVSVKNETAMLTTFNEVDMSQVMALREKHQKAFTEKHGQKLGFMSFFTKAAALALQQFPKVNSQIDGEHIIFPEYCDIGIAVQTDKGLMVPVLRNTETMNLAQIEKNIAELASKARAARLSIEDMTGGTFTITNGGVFGSLLSTPILNPPQSAILGMHNIVERPVAINGKVEVRPMMYLALSYDHRTIDGKDSVSFLVKIKELIENPLKLLYNYTNPEKHLLDI